LNSTEYRLDNRTVHAFPILERPSSLTAPNTKSSSLLQLLSAEFFHNWGIVEKPESSVHRQHGRRQTARSGPRLHRGTEVGGQDRLDGCSPSRVPEQQGARDPQHGSALPSISRCYPQTLAEIQHRGSSHSGVSQLSFPAVTF
jgi:hypothetical protein